MLELTINYLIIFPLVALIATLLKLGLAEIEGVRLTAWNWSIFVYVLFLVTFGFYLSGRVSMLATYWPLLVTPALLFGSFAIIEFFVGYQQLEIFKRPVFLHRKLAISVFAGLATLSILFTLLKYFNSITALQQNLIQGCTIAPLALIYCVSIIFQKKHDINKHTNNFARE